MKKSTIGVLIIFVLCCFVFASCGSKGGTVEIFNDTETTQRMSIRYDGKLVFDDNIYAAQTISKVSQTDTSYAVFKGSSSSTAVKSGSLSGGETITIRISEIN